MVFGRPTAVSRERRRNCGSHLSGVLDLGDRTKGMGGWVITIDHVEPGHPKRGVRRLIMGGHTLHLDP
jgi:hypothetical protein